MYSVQAPSGGVTALTEYNGRNRVLSLRGVELFHVEETKPRECVKRTGRIRQSRTLGTGSIGKWVGTVLQRKTETVRCFGTSIVVEETGSTVLSHRKIRRLTGSRDKRTGRVGKSRNVMRKRVLCGDNNSRVVGDFGRKRGRGRKSGKSQKQWRINTVRTLWRWKFKSSGFGRGRGRGHGSGRIRDGNERDHMLHVTCVMKNRKEVDRRLWM
ncbi:hypothetical protein Tco_0578824 [Tanacetum coccineum]